MKTFYLWMAALCSLAGTLFAQSPAHITFHTMETSTTGQATLAFSLVAEENLSIEEAPIWKLPTGMQATTQGLPGYMAAGDSIVAQATLTYNTNNLPYYPQQLGITLPVITAGIANAKTINPLPTDTITVRGKAHLYFTPYQTLEVWSVVDFLSLNRVWASSSQPAPARIAVSQSTIPVSSLDNYADPYDEDTLELVHIEGLAYDIPMFPSEALPYKTHLPGDDELPAANAKTSGLVFSGTVTGRLVAHYVNDLGITVTMPLAGLKVILKDEDIDFNDYLGETHTDDNGYFSINYLVPQEPFEGGQVDLFIKVKAKNGTHNIRFPVPATSACLDGTHASIPTPFTVGEKIYLGGNNNNGTLAAGNIFVDNDVFKAVHRAYRGWTYVEEQGYDLRGGLHILPTTRDGSYFSTNFADLCGKYFPSTIFLNPRGMQHEGTMYHELGHFIEFQLAEGKDESSFYWGEKHYWGEENSSRAAFAEGWASAFAAILDAHCWRDDEEFAYYDWSTPGFCERRVEYDTLYINNGIQSEYYISTAIYDLWDGPDKGLPEVMPGTEGIHGWNDLDDDVGEIRPWKRYKDNLSLPFGLLLKPFENAPFHIGDYVNELLNSGQLSCDQRGKLSRVLRENDIVYDIADEDEHERTTALNTDTYFTFIHQEQHGLNWKNELKSWWDTYEVNAFVGDHEDRYDLIINENVSFSDQVVLNTQGVSGDPLVIAFNNNIASAPSSTNTTICGGNGLRIQEGLVLIGDENHAVHLTLKNGSLVHVLDDTGLPNTGLELFGNSSLIVEDEGMLLAEIFGHITLHDNAQIIVKNGGSIVLENNSRLHLLDNSKLVIEEGAYTCFKSPDNINTNGRGALAIDFESTPIIGWQNFIRAGNKNYDPNTDNCLGILDIFSNDFGVNLQATTTPDCNDPNFRLELTGNTIPQDAAIYWYVPEQWVNYNENQNGNFWLNTITGHLNGATDGGTVNAIIKSPAGIQQKSLYFPPIPKPELTYNPTFTDIYVCLEQEIINGEAVIPRLRATATGGTGPYTFQWSNNQNVNYTSISDNGYDYEVVIDSVQPTRTPQVTQLTATDQLGCTSVSVPFTIYPSENTWEFLPLAVPENRVNTLAGATNRNTIITDSQNNIYFTGDNGQIVYYYWDETATYPNQAQSGLWLPQHTGLSGSAGSLSLFETANTIHFYYKGTDNCLYTFTKDKTTNTFSTATTYGNCNGNVKDMVHATGVDEVFYRNTNNQLVMVAPGVGQYTYSTTYPVHGFNLVAANDRLYYKSYSNLVVLDRSQHATGTTTNINAAIADHSYLAINSAEEVFYTTYNNGILQAKRNTDGTYQADIALPYQTNPDSEYTGSNGQMTINPVSGVVYYVGWNGHVYQLYLNSDDAWLSVDIGRYNIGIQSQTPMHYRSPHLFYTQSDGHIGNSFYYDSGCYSLVEKSGEQQANFSISPNPASKELYITFGADEGDNVRLQLINMIGQLAHAESWKATEEGYQEQSSTVNHLPAGTYVCRLLVNDSEVAYRKVVIVD